MPNVTYEEHMKSHPMPESTPVVKQEVKSAKKAGKK